MNAFLEVSCSSFCINHCVYCPQSYIREESENRLRFLTMENFKLCIDKLPCNSIVSFAGFSEPCSNPNFVDMVLYAYYKGHNIWLFSTFVNLTIEQYQRIMHIPFQFCSIHLPDSEGRTLIRITGKYIDLLRFIMHNPPKGLILHHHGNNVHHEISAIITKSFPLPLHDRAGNLVIEDKRIQKGHYSGNLKCGHTFLFKFPKGGALLNYDGNVYLCCNDFGLKHKLGSLLEKSWEDIMSGSEMKKVLRGLSDESEEILCRSCIYAEKQSF